MKITIGMKDMKRRTMITEIILVCCLLAAIVYTGYLIFAKFNPYGLDSDIVNEISYRQASWEQKTLFPEDFYSTNESMVTRPVLLYWLFYGITHNYLLSFQLENMCTLLLELALIGWLMRGLALSRSIRLLCLFMFVVTLPSSFRYVDFWPMNPYVNSIMFFLVELVLRIILRKAIDESKHRGAILLPAADILLLAALSGYGTIRLMMWLFFPVVVLDVGRVLLNYMKNIPQSKADLVVAGVSIAAAVLNFAFYLVFLHFHGDFIYTPAIGVVDAAGWLDWEVISEQLYSILAIFGLTEVKAAGAFGMAGFLLSACVAVLEFASVLWLFFWKKVDPKRRELAWLWLIGITVNFIYLVISNGYSPIRYYTTGALLLPVLSGCAISDWTYKRSERTDNWPCLVIAAGIAVFLGANIRMDAMQLFSSPPELSQVAAYIKDNGYKYVTGSYWNAGVIKGYTNGAVEALHCSVLQPEDIETLTPFYWLIDGKGFSEERDGIPNILLLTDEEEARVNERGGAVSRMLRENAEKVQEIGQYDLYALTQNPFVLTKRYNAGLPPESMSNKTVYPDSEGFIFSNAEINDKHELVSNGTEGYILWGPYSESVPGTYDITLRYSVDSFTDSDVGTFDVALDTQGIADCHFTSQETSATIKNVEIESRHAFEARVTVPAGMIVRVQSIEYERVG